MMIAGDTNIEDIRLVGGSYNYSGNVQILYNGTWGTICDSGWSYNDARVACRYVILKIPHTPIDTNMFFCLACWDSVLQHVQFQMLDMAGQLRLFPSGCLT